jgi:hypothetical protein
MKPTRAQQDVINRLRDGWTIQAETDEYMTLWADHRGVLTREACAISTLHAMRRMGIVEHRGTQWVLTQKANE